MTRFRRAVRTGLWIAAGLWLLGGVLWLARREGDPLEWALLAVGAALIVAMARAPRHPASEKREPLADFVLQNLVPMAVTAADSGRILEVNDAFLKGAGLQREAVVGRTTFELGVWPTNARRERFLQALSSGQPAVELEVDVADGRRLRLLCSATRVSFRGQPCLVVSILDRTEAREALSLREERLRLALEGSGEGFWEWNPATQEIHVGARVYALLGYAAGDFPSTVAEWVTRIHPDDREAATREAVTQVASGEGRMRVELRAFAKDGEQRVILVRGQVAARDQAGQPTRILGTLVDITRRRRAEIELQATYERIRDILEGISDGFFALDRQLVVRAFNRAAEGLLGRPRQEVMGRNLFEAFPELRGSVFEERFREVIEQNGAQSFETRVTVTPYVGWYEVRAHPIRDGVSVFFRSTTERKRLEAQLVQAQKMEAIGRLAGGVAHDFNNQLAAIMGYDELLLRDLPEGHSGRPRAEQIRKAAQRAAVLTRQLLAFGRRQVLEPQILDLNAVVAEVEELLRRTIGEDITLVTQLDAELGHVRADRSQVEQAILNLVVNARDALQQGGQITIETGNSDLDEAYCAQHLGASPGSHVRLVIADTGSGMDGGTLGRLFEPFFTTKEFGKGSGLGLAMVYGFVRQSGGHISVESAPHQGSRFLIYLPRVSGPAPRAAPAPSVSSTSHSAKGETILVVEDEPAVRRLIVEVLRAAGYRVLEAADGEDGRRVGEAHPDPIQLLVTDVIMPCMSGHALAAILSRARPDMRVLFLSGHTEGALDADGATPLRPLLEKPFTPTTLVQRVRQTLAAPPPPPQTAT